MIKGVAREEEDDEINYMAKRDERPVVLKGEADWKRTRGTTYKHQ